MLTLPPGRVPATVSIKGANTNNSWQKHLELSSDSGLAFLYQWGCMESGCSILTAQVGIDQQGPLLWPSGNTVGGGDKWVDHLPNSGWKKRPAASDTSGSLAGQAIPIVQAIFKMR